MKPRRRQTAAPVKSELEARHECLGPDPSTPQPESFSFDAEYRAKADVILSRYPEDRKASAVIPLLDLAQRQSGGWLPQAAMDHVAEVLEMAPIRVYEVATFYTMFNLRPRGRYFVQLCRTTPCWLRGSDDIRTACEKELGITIGETTEDGLFSMVEVECLGACVNAPMIQINDDYYEDLTPDSVVDLLKALRRGDAVRIGSQSGRQFSAPEGGPTTLVGAVSAGGS